MAKRIRRKKNTVAKSAVKDVVDVPPEPCLEREEAVTPFVLDSPVAKVTANTAASEEDIADESKCADKEPCCVPGEYRVIVIVRGGMVRDVLIPPDFPDGSIVEIRDYDTDFTNSKSVVRSDDAGVDFMFKQYKKIT